jgi:leucyl/phenylalanyl-tRNA---protein transferase
MANRIPPRELLGLYASGWFPMGMEDGSIRCFSPDPRGIIPLDGFHIPHGARRAIEDPAWEYRIDTCCEEVVRSCAKREETWIDDCIVESYLALHEMGYAHSVEVWREGELAGGLYGVRLGAAFFGESMFHRQTGASKAALAHLIAKLLQGGFLLLDTQWVTPHLVRFGAVEIPREEYLLLLGRAMESSAVWPLRASEA